MATAAQIKSAIRSKSSAERGVSQQLANVESLLQQADFSSKMADLEAKQKETMFATAASGLELASTFGEGLKQKAELESNIKAFEESLPDAVRKAGGVSVVENPNRASLMDVLKGKKGSLTSYLTEEKEQYMLGENVLGSKYDVAAMGEKAKALKQTDLLDRFMEGEPLDSKSPTLQSSLQLGSEGMPTLTKDFSSIYGKDTDIESLQDSVDKPLIKEDTTEKNINEIIVESEIGSPLEPNFTRGPLAPELIENNNLASFLLGGEITGGDYTMSQPIDEPTESISERYAKANFQNTKETRKITADVLSDKIKDLKIARKNLKGLPKYDKRNKEKFSSLVSEREQELKDLLSKVYNPELDVFFGDDFKGANLRGQLEIQDKDSISFIKDFVSR
jgi:hypothetical protein|tara:strand:+ start:5941 stop:7116 length:1176 start_codon:yes stop_codon:yes gene_type:complete